MFYVVRCCVCVVPRYVQLRFVVVTYPVVVAFILFCYVVDVRYVCCCYYPLVTLVVLLRFGCSSCCVVPHPPHPFYRICPVTFLRFTPVALPLHCSSSPFTPVVGLRYCCGLPRCYTFARYVVILLLPYVYFTFIYSCSSYTHTFHFILVLSWFTVVYSPTFPFVVQLLQFTFDFICFVTFVHFICCCCSVTFPSCSVTFIYPSLPLQFWLVVSYLVYILFTVVVDLLQLLLFGCLFVGCCCILRVLRCPHVCCSYLLLHLCSLHLVLHTFTFVYTFYSCWLVAVLRLPLPLYLYSFTHTFYFAFCIYFTLPHLYPQLQHFTYVTFIYILQLRYFTFTFYLQFCYFICSYLCDCCCYFVVTFYYYVGCYTVYSCRVLPQFYFILLPWLPYVYVVDCILPVALLLFSYVYLYCLAPRYLLLVICSLFTFCCCSYVYLRLFTRLLCCCLHVAHTFTFTFTVSYYLFYYFSYVVLRLRLFILFCCLLYTRLLLLHLLLPVTRSIYVLHVTLLCPFVHCCSLQLPVRLPCSCLYVTFTVTLLLVAVILPLPLPLLALVAAVTFVLVFTFYVYILQLQFTLQLYLHFTPRLRWILFYLQLLFQFLFALTPFIGYVCCCCFAVVPLFYSCASLHLLHLLLLQLPFPRLPFVVYTFAFCCLLRLQLRLRYPSLDCWLPHPRYYSCSSYFTFTLSSLLCYVVVVLPQLPCVVAGWLRWFGYPTLLLPTPYTHVPFVALLFTFYSLHVRFILPF